MTGSSGSPAPWDGVAGCWIIAEVGVNHNGDLALAHRLVDAAATAGADCVKFQTFNVDKVAANSAATAPYQLRAVGQDSQRAMLKRLELPETAWPELMSHVSERGLTFLSTPFDVPSAALLVDAGMELLKVPSGELTNLPFIEAMAGFDVPLIMSTGMATLAEVADAVSAADAAPALALLHCISAYPAPPEQANLRAITTLADAFQLPVGWSDHTTGALTGVGAVVLGARIIEKHITLDTRMHGPDHRASADPDAFGHYVDTVRRAEAIGGSGIKKPQPAELDNLVPARRSWHAALDLPAGHVLCQPDLIALRPATGIPPSTSLIGRRLVVALAAGEPLNPQHLEALGGDQATAP